MNWQELLVLISEATTRALEQGETVYRKQSGIAAAFPMREGYEPWEERWYAGTGKRPKLANSQSPV